MKRKILLPLIACAALVTSLVSIGITYCAYVKYAQISQDIDVAGSRYIYLKPTSNWNHTGATFFIYAWQDNSTWDITTHDSTLSFTDGGETTLVFPHPKYSAGFKFIRAKSGMTLSTMRADRDKAIRHTSDHGGYAWNWTDDITDNSLSSYNMFTITTVKSSGSMIFNYTPSLYSSI